MRPSNRNFADQMECRQSRLVIDRVSSPMGRDVESLRRDECEPAEPLSSSANDEVERNPYQPQPPSPYRPPLLDLESKAGVRTSAIIPGRYFAKPSKKLGMPLRELSIVARKRTITLVDSDEEDGEYIEEIEIAAPIRHMSMCADPDMSIPFHAPFLSSVDSAGFRTPMRSKKRTHMPNRSMDFDRIDEEGELEVRPSLLDQHLMVDSNDSQHIRTDDKADLDLHRSASSSSQLGETTALGLAPHHERFRKLSNQSEASSFDGEVEPYKNNSGGLAPHRETLVASSQPSSLRETSSVGLSRNDSMATFFRTMGSSFRQNSHRGISPGRLMSHNDPLPKGVKRRHGIWVCASWAIYHANRDSLIETEYQVKVMSYNPVWARDANRVVNCLKTMPGSENWSSCEHIGSTSVPQLSAKPILDVMITFPPEKGVFIKLLKQFHMNCKGIEQDLPFKICFVDRSPPDFVEAWGFFQVPGQSCRRQSFRGAGIPVRSVNVHFYAEGSKNAIEKRRFRDFLTSPEGFELRDEYARVKMDLAKKIEDGQLAVNDYAKSKNSIVAKIAASALEWSKKKRPMRSESTHSPIHNPSLTKFVSDTPPAPVHPSPPPGAKRVVAKQLTKWISDSNEQNRISESNERRAPGPALWSPITANYRKDAFVTASSPSGPYPEPLSPTDDEGLEQPGLMYRKTIPLSPIHANDSGASVYVMANANSSGRGGKTRPSVPLTAPPELSTPKGVPLLPKDGPSLRIIASNVSVPPLPLSAPGTPVSDAPDSPLSPQAFPPMSRVTTNTPATQL